MYIYDVFGNVIGYVGTGVGGPTLKMVRIGVVV